MRVVFHTWIRICSRKCQVLHFSFSLNHRFNQLHIFIELRKWHKRNKIWYFELDLLLLVLKE